MQSADGADPTRLVDFDKHGPRGSTWQDGRVNEQSSSEPRVRSVVGTADARTDSSCRSPLGTFAECPLCGGGLAPEHAHFRCGSCGWRDSCCD